MTDKQVDQIILCLTQLMQDQKRILELLEGMKPEQQYRTAHQAHPPIRIFADDKPKERK